MIDEPDTKHNTANIKKYLEDNKKYIDTLCINNSQNITNPGQINTTGKTCNSGDAVFTDGRIDKILKNSKIKDVVRVFKAKNRLINNTSDNSRYQRVYYSISPYDYLYYPYYIRVRPQDKYQRGGTYKLIKSDRNNGTILGSLYNKSTKETIPIKYIDFDNFKEQYNDYYSPTKKIDAFNDLHVSTHGRHEEMDKAYKLLKVIENVKNINEGLNYIEHVLDYLEYYMFPLKTVETIKEIRRGG
jgi:hypothetical protein